MENMQNQNNDHKEDKGDKGISNLIVIFLILLAVCFFFYKYVNQIKKPTPLEPLVSNTLPTGYHYEDLTKNKYPSGFPEAVIVKDASGISPVWQRAEDTTTAAGKELKVVELIYKNTAPTTLVTLFDKTFKNDGWILDAKVKTSNTPPIVRIYNKAMEGVMKVATLTILKSGTADALVNITITTK